EVRADHVLEQVPVGVRLAEQLGQDRGAPNPHVLLARPRTYPGRDSLRVRRQDRRDPVGGDVVHVVPPRPGEDEVSVQLEGRGVLPLPVVTMARQRNGGVALLAVRRAVPQDTDGVLPGGAVGRPSVGVERTQEAGQVRGGDAVERHRRLHVALLRVGTFGVAGGTEYGPNLVDEYVVSRHRRPSATRWSRLSAPTLRRASTGIARPTAALVRRRPEWDSHGTCRNRARLFDDELRPH